MRAARRSCSVRRTLTIGCPLRLKTSSLRRIWRRPRSLGCPIPRSRAHRPISHRRCASFAARRTALDRKTREIHISPDIDHDGQRRFKTLHEVTHDILPWQEDVAYADDGMTLSWSTRIKFEQEANQGGAELLFQRELFETMAADYEIGFPAIVELSERFGSSIHAAFRRYVETHKRRVGGVVLDKSPCQADPLGYKRREAVGSASWTDRYDNPADWPKVLCGQPYRFVNDIELLTSFAHPTPTMSYPDLDGEPTQIRVELFSNSYSVFVLLWGPRRERFKRKRIIVPSAAIR